MNQKGKARHRVILTVIVRTRPCGQGWQGSTYRTRTGIRSGDFECNRDLSPIETIGLREGTDENLSESRQNPLRFNCPGNNPSRRPSFLPPPSFPQVQYMPT